ncbi:hypothetical protein GZ78_03225 [Endozoicomonas numazuensis]|uniref:Uncharacterized protein n=2 Tax=Endozoicomonas numazuensis TaxID=1137799 RepID=A0A081NKT1_9GAMM|nr:hypothetical protein GZ78_03225 [Endozoicomonas numazuensis]
MINNAWPQNDLKLLDQLMTLSPGTVSDKSMEFYSAGSDLLVSQKNLATEHLTVLMILNGPELQPIEGQIEWSTDGTHWYNAEFDKESIRSGTTGHIQVSLPKLAPSNDLQRIVFRTRLTGHNRVHESRQLVTVLPYGEARQAVFYDIGGTVQAKYKLAAKKQKTSETRLTQFSEPFMQIFKLDCS